MILTNPRHERFAQELAAGKSASEAYVAAGYKSNRGNAATLKQQQSISRRVHEILAVRQTVEAKAVELAIERTAISKEWVLERLRENVERSMAATQATDQDGKPAGEFRYEGSVANRALELLGKELGMFISRSEVGKPGDFTAVTDDELADIIRRGSGRGNGADAPQVSAPEPSKLH